MVSNRNNDGAYYRCMYPAPYAAATRPDHPTGLYLARTRSSAGRPLADPHLLPGAFNATLNDLRDAQASEIDQAGIAAVIDLS